MAAFRGNFPENLEPWVTDIIFQRYSRIDPIFRDIFKTETDDKAFVDQFKVAGLGTFALKPEGTPVSYDDPVEGPRKRQVHSTYALGFRITKEMWDDEQHGIMKKMPSDLGDSARDHQETIAHGPINDAFTGAQFTGLDGLSLCNASHPNLRTGTLQSNTDTDALTATALEEILTDIELATSEEDRPIKQNIRHLLVHPNNRWNAQTILETEYAPGGNDNDINTMISSRTGLQPYVSRYLTDTTDWFVLCEEHTITWYDREELNTDSGKDFNTKDMLFDACYRASVGFWDWRGVYGRSVAGA